MPDLVASLLPALENYRLPGLELGNGVVYPNYAGYNLCNLPSSICRWLEIPQFGCSPLAENIHSMLPDTFHHVILLVVDGMGLRQFQRVLNTEHQKLAGAAVWNRLLPDALLVPLTSMAPSTTSAVLTSLWTGCYPSEHGIIGYEVFLKEYGMIVNMISHSPAAFQGDLGGLRRAGFQAETFLPSPTLGPHLAANGVEAFAFQHNAIARSGLTVMHSPQVNVIPFRTQSDLWVTLTDLLETRTAEKSYTYIYWGDVDELAHRYGPEDERCTLEFASFSLMLERFLGRLKNHARGDTLLLMTADHGQIYTPRQSSFELKNHPEMMSCLVMNPSGEARLSLLFVRPGQEVRLQEYVAHAWPDQFRLLPARAVLKDNLLGNGPVYSKVHDRIGDWVAIPQGNAYWWWPDKENGMLGRHGGLSAAEMLVPLVAMVL